MWLNPKRRHISRYAEPTGASAHSSNWSDRPVVDHASTAASGGRLTRFEKDPGARTSTSFGAIKKAIG
jgi:hypothetical protein